MSTSNVTCIECDRSVLDSDINIAADIAKCAACGTIFKVSEALDSRKDDLGSFDIANAPSGTSFERTVNGFRLQATTRSYMAFFIVPFTLVWSGGSLGGIYGSQLASGNFNMFPSLFGLPFLIGSIFLIGYAAMTVMGRVEVSADNYDGRVFVGVGPIGWSKRFNWREIDEVIEGTSSFKTNNRNHQNIQLQGSRRISFGSQLNSERRYYVIRALQQLLKQLT